MESHGEAPAVAAATTAATAAAITTTAGHEWRELPMVLPRDQGVARVGPVAPLPGAARPLTLPLQKTVGPRGSRRLEPPLPAVHTLIGLLPARRLSNSRRRPCIAPAVNPQQLCTLP